MANVLLIETKGTQQRLAAWVLGDAGFDVSKADGVADAIALADRHPSVIIFNTGLPAGEKRAAILRLRAVSPESHIVDVSEPAERPRNRGETGADAYLSLPYDAETLLECVQTLISRESAASR